jgi:hypothetical protein
MRYGIVALPRWCVGALAVALVCLLALAGGARAETFKASNTAQLVEAVSKANANPGANTIQLAGATYLPTATLTFTNTTGVQTVEGPTTLPAARVDGAQVEPLGSELFALKASVAVTFKNVDETSGGGSGVAPAIDDFGTLVVESSTLAGNNGQGVRVEGGATATMRNSTLSDGLDFGLVNNGTASFFNSTVAFNKFGLENQGTLKLTNTIVAKNTSGDCVLGAGTSTTSDHSLDSDGTCSATLSKMDPLLNTKLIFQGGSTPTHAISQFTSPAHDAGNIATCTTVDQRGFTRPDDAATACDLGAVEGVPPTVETKAATLVTQTSATLNASVNPNAFLVSECKLEYGLTTSYGKSAPCTPKPGSGTTAEPVSAALESLEENTEYHFRISATNVNGTNVGADATFKTTLVMGPHWYKNRVRIAEGALEGAPQVMSWGSLTIENATVGAFTCLTLAGGDVGNPVGGGAGKGVLEGVTFYDCTAPTCEADKGLQAVITEKPEWSAVLVEETAMNKDRIESIALREICVGGTPESNVEFHGVLKPNVESGTSIGAAPSKLEFSATTGELQSGAGAGKVIAKLKLMGYETGELLQAKTP